MTDRVIHAQDLDGTRGLAEDGKAFVKVDGTSIKFNASGQLEAKSAPVHESEVVIATDAMTTHTLVNGTPIGKVIVTRNGQDISDSWSWDGNVGTYDPSKNLDCTIDADDKLRFHYETAAV